MSNNPTERPRAGGGLRPGFVFALLSAAVTALAIGWLLRPRPEAPPKHSDKVWGARPEEPAQTHQSVGGRLAGAVSQVSLADQLGIQVSALHLTAAGRAVDLRYTVVDAAKAASLANRSTRACLIDQATGRRLMLSGPPRRASAQGLAQGRQYGLLFAGAGHALERGSKLSLIIGDAREDNLILQ